jgi:exonuclease SbcD
LLQAITDYYQQQYQAACELRGDSVLPIIASGHLTTVGASKVTPYVTSISARWMPSPRKTFRLRITSRLGIFTGRKSRRQEHIRYCGSPIALSFDETGNSKYVNLVTFSAGKLADVTALEVPVTQQLAVIKGDLASIRQQLEQWRGSGCPVWLDIEIATEDYLSDMQRKIQALTADLPVEVLLVRRSREQRSASSRGASRNPERVKSRRGFRASPGAGGA